MFTQSALAILFFGSRFYQLGIPMKVTLFMIWLYQHFYTFMKWQKILLIIIDYIACKEFAFNNSYYFISSTIFIRL